MTDVDYAIEPDLSAAAFIDLLHRSTLAKRRPVDDPARIARMLQGADLIVTARIAGTLVGVARAITDGAYCLYLSDLAVDQAYQGQGLGRALLRRVKREAGEAVGCFLVSAPRAVTFYDHIGLRRRDCFSF